MHDSTQACAIQTFKHSNPGACNLEYADAVPDLPAALRAAVAAGGTGRRPADPSVRITEPGPAASTAAAAAERAYARRGGSRAGKGEEAGEAVLPAGAEEERVEWRQGQAYNISYSTKVSLPYNLPLPYNLCRSVGPGSL